MNSFLIFLISLVSLGDSSTNENTQPVQETFTTYYFIRHAEKKGGNKYEKDPQLSKAGLERAARWAEVLKKVEFDLIFSTETKRTLNTASAIASSQKKEVNIYDPGKLFDPKFQEKTFGKTVLVVGHSNTNPAFVNRILGEEKYKDLDETEYGSLFIVTVSSNGEKSSQVLYIN